MIIYEKTMYKMGALIPKLGLRNTAASKKCCELSQVASATDQGKT
jgi:hypothetical protein